MHLRYRSIAIVLIGILQAVWGVDRSKFKTCSQSSFCRQSLKEKALIGGLAGHDGTVKLKMTNGEQLSIEVYAEGVVRLSSSGTIQKDFSESMHKISWSPLFPSLETQMSMTSSDGQFYLKVNIDSVEFISEHGKVSIQNMIIDKVKGNQVEISFPNGSKFYGLPLHSTPLQLPITNNAFNGNQTQDNEPLRLYNSDVFEYELNSPMALYGAIPMVIGRSAESFAGLFWNDPADTFADISETSVTFMSEGTGNAVDVFFYLSNGIKEVIKKHSIVTGKPDLPPLFALGYHQCRWNYRDEKDVRKVNEGFDQHGIPYDVLWLDIEHTDEKKYFTFDSLKFPHPDQLAAELDERGKRKLVVIVDPHIKVDPEYFVYNELVEKEFAVKYNTNNDNLQGDCWPGKSVWVDFVNEKASAWWSSLFPKSYPSSNIYIWNDMNEPAVFNIDELTFPRDAIHTAKNNTLIKHSAIHNLYGQLMHKATREGLLLRSPNKRPFVLSRSFYAGTQSIGPIWTGDNAATWEHLKASIPMTLSLGLAGMPFVGADVGGFFGNPEPELLVRWYQLGALQPFFRGHAHIETRRREPWLFGEPYTGFIKKAIRLRYRLLPFIYSMFHLSHNEGIPVNRPIFMEFPHVDDHSMQFMIGDALLFAPILSKNVTEHEIVLPSGQWFDFETLEHVDNEFTMKASLDSIPLFIRGGSIITLKDMPRRSTWTMTKDPYTILVALDLYSEAHGESYIDDGDTFDYQKGHKCHSKLQFKEGRLSNKKFEGQIKTLTGPSVDVREIIIIGAARPSKVLINKKKHDHYVYANGRLSIKSLYLRMDAEWNVVMVN